MPTSKESTSPIILIAILLLGFIAGYFYYAQVLQDTIPHIPPPTINSQDNLGKFKSLSLDFSIFDNDHFKALHIFGESPVAPGSTGRADPFAPF